MKNSQNPIDSDGPIRARITFRKPITLVGDVEFLRDVDGNVTHISILTDNRQRPTLIPYRWVMVEPIQAIRFESVTERGEDSI